MTGQLSVTLANRLPEIARLAGLVEAFGEAHGLPADLVFSLSVSLDEVLSNVFSYAYDDTGAHEVHVRVTLDGDQVSVEVEDDGRPFNPLEARAPDIRAGLDRPGTGGFGLHIVRSLMDALDYRREGGRNIMSMTKRRPTGGGTAGS